MERRPRPPIPLVLSCLFGALGLVAIVVGTVADSDGLFVAAFALGALSLAAALYWRSELISAWRRGGPGGTAH